MYKTEEIICLEALIYSNIALTRSYMTDITYNATLIWCYYICGSNLSSKNNAYSKKTTYITFRLRSLIINKILY